MTTTTESETDVEEASEFGQLLKPIQPHLEKYGSKIVLGLAAFLLVAAVYIWWTRSSAAAAAAGWGGMATANAPEDYADIADENPGTPAAAWARLSAANGYLTSAIRLSFTDRKASSGSFDKARTEFDKLLNKRGTPKGVRERALYGIARLEESTSGDDTATAVSAYEKLLSEFPESAYKAMAEQRIAKLKSDDSQSFYGWFAKQQPSVADDLIIPNDDLPGTPGAAETGAADLDTILKGAGLPATPGTVEGGDGAAPPAPADGEIPETPVGVGEEVPAAPVLPGGGEEVPPATPTSEEKSSGDK
jgi:hypothetical protein